ncbi:30S ribosomal protein S10 [Hibiscus syriacus]|uniref:Small ribosomal subunit protein uS10c n=1 Tax=Hibiscus syriacus TaxID=106335 RepID=A0A6A2X0M2_HIBSY|nr:30S ribosomal protein S10, chloroplastic-like [Hibiscus syriacus]KAE8667841.1 30S ribosomal protein S10 [Hibiscus syriacus]
MAVSSISSSLFPSLTIPNSSSPKPRLSFLSRPSPLSFNPLKLPNCSLKLSQSTKVFAAPDDLVETPEVGGSELPASSSVTLEADKAAPKQKIRIKLRSYWVPLIEDSCKQILDAARTTNAKMMGPVSLPTKKRIYCVLKSPHVHKDARFHFEIRTHQRLIDILYPTAQTIDSLMQLDLPAGVDVEVKL